MIKNSDSLRRRKDPLSRERIIEAAIALLDNHGEAGLTFQALSRRLGTGPGAIYWHISNKDDLLTAACDAIISRTVNAPSSGTTPETAIRTLALGMFDAIDDHPWVGAALSHAPGQPPALRILEGIGQQIQRLGVPLEAHWVTVSALLSYIVGVAGQNAANAQFARAYSLDRSDFLGQVSAVWSRLDPAEFPFVRGIAGQLPEHDDREDFLAGIDFILAGIVSMKLG